MKLKMMTAALCVMLTLSLSAQNNTDNEVREGDKTELKAHRHGPRHNQKCKEELKELAPEKMAVHRADGLREELNLTDKQYEQVYALCLEQAEEMKARKDERKANADKAEKAERPSKEEFDKKRDENDAKMKAILNEEQFAKYKELRANDHRGPRKHGPGPERDGKKASFQKTAEVNE